MDVLIPTSIWFDTVVVCTVPVDAERAVDQPARFPDFILPLPLEFMLAVGILVDNRFCS